MRLTDEQHQVVEAAQGRPVQVVDPQTNRAYVLLMAESFQRIRSLLGEALGPEPATADPITTEPNCPVKLRDLPMPAEVGMEAHRYCKDLGLTRQSHIEQVQDELRLQFYFGGKCVAYLRSEDGPIVVAAGNTGSELFDHQLSRLARLV